MKTWYIIIIVLFITLTVLAVILLFPKTAQSTREISVSGRTLNVLVANSAGERIKGLSGVELDELGADGMMFTFKTSEILNFWMYNMQFDLDVVWIANGEVVKIDYAVPAPHSGETTARMSSDPFEVDTVLELPAGMATIFDLYPGQNIQLD